jgi:hypothetical protein
MRGIPRAEVPDMPDRIVAQPVCIIWLYVARQVGSIEIADKVADSITDRFVALGRNPQMGNRRNDLAPACEASRLGITSSCIETTKTTRRYCMSSTVAATSNRSFAWQRSDHVR